MPQVVVVHSVNLPIHLIGSRPVQGTKAAGGVASKPRLHCDQLRKVAPVQRGILERSPRHRRGLEGNVGGGNFDRDGGLGQNQFYRHCINRARTDRYVVRGGDGESAGRNGEFVRTQRKVLNSELAVACGDGAVLDPGGSILGSYGCFWNHCPGGIRNAAVYRSAKCLCMSPRPYCKKNKQSPKLAHVWALND